MAEETETETEETETEEKEEPRALSQEDINKLIEAARKQEKDKLYGTIDELKTQIRGLSDSQKQEKDEKDKLAKEAREAEDKEKMAKLSAEDRMAEQLKRFEERLAKEAKHRETLEEQLQEEREVAALERYKSELLTEAGDEVIRELVQGKTKEELKDSVAVARAKYQQIFQAAFDQAKGEPGRTVQPNITSQMPKPADPDPDPLDEEDMRALDRPTVTQGSMKSREEIIAAKNRGVAPEYMKRREEIAAKAAELYQRSAGR